MAFRCDASSASYSPRAKPRLATASLKNERSLSRAKGLAVPPAQTARPLGFGPDKAKILREGVGQVSKKALHDAGSPSLTAGVSPSAVKVDARPRPPSPAPGPRDAPIAMLGPHSPSLVVVACLFRRYTSIPTTGSRVRMTRPNNRGRSLIDLPIASGGRSCLASAHGLDQARRGGFRPHSPAGARLLCNRAP